MSLDKPAQGGSVEGHVECICPHKFLPDVFTSLISALSQQTTRQLTRSNWFDPTYKPGGRMSICTEQCDVREYNYEPKQRTNFLTWTL
jgi:hypothetical protein